MNFQGLHVLFQAFNECEGACTFSVSAWAAAATEPSTSPSSPSFSDCRTSSAIFVVSTLMFACTKSRRAYDLTAVRTVTRCRHPVVAGITARTARLAQARVREVGWGGGGWLHLGGGGAAGLLQGGGRRTCSEDTSTGISFCARRCSLRWILRRRSSIMPSMNRFSCRS